MKRFIFSAILIISLINTEVMSQCYLTVNNINNEGTGSLRQAIIDANACSGPPTIVFSLSSSDTITLTSDLPSLNHSNMVIDGTTASGFSYPSSMVTINWEGRDDCFDQHINNVTIRGLAFTNNFNGNGDASIRSWDGSNLTVEYCKAFNQNKRFVKAQGGTGIKVQYCTIYNFANDGGALVFQVSSGGFDLISNCVINNIPRRIFELNNSNAIVTTIQYNILNNIGYEDNSSLGGKGSHAFFSNYQGTRLTIRNNTVNGCKSKFVEISRGNTMIIQQDSIYNNKVLNCTGQHVIFIQGKSSSWPYVCYNYIDGDGGVHSMDQVIELNAPDWGKIRGNVIKNAKARGIMMRNSDGTVIKENVMYNLSNGPAIELNDDCDGVIIRGNIIGTDSLDTQGISLFTEDLIALNNCDDCFVGGDINLGLGNQIIASPGKRAIRVSSSCEGLTTIWGNDINVSKNGLTCLSVSNSPTIEVDLCAVQIGGNTSQYRNRIAGQGRGIQINSNVPGATIEGNLLGCTQFGSQIEGSSMEYGIVCSANNITIGSKTTQSLRNKIGFCQEAIRNENKNNVLWAGNEYWNNTASSVVNNNGAGNGGIQPPVITGGTLPNTVFGTAEPGARVEVYHWNTSVPVQGYEYLGKVNADASGNWTFSSPNTFQNQIAALQINGLNSSEFTSFNGLAIDPPTANDDSSIDNIVGTNTILNILSNDQLSDGSTATPGMVSTDIDLTIPGEQSVLVVAGEGIWTYEPSTGDLTFDPDAGFTSNPAIIQYVLTETASGFSDAAIVKVSYIKTPPIANDDASLENTAGSNVVLNILANDQMSDGSNIMISMITVDINTEVIGIQNVRIVPGEGTWTYDNPTGNLTFNPLPGAYTPTPLTYKLYETATGLSDNAIVTLTYLILPPQANDDASIGNYYGAMAVIEILTNDFLLDGSNPLPELISVDIDPNTAGNQSLLAIEGEGNWAYNSMTGGLIFIPENGFYSDPTNISYTLTENGTGLFDNATVSAEYSLGPNMNPPLNLQAGVINTNNVELTWDPPTLTSGDILNWDNGFNFDGIGLNSGGTFSVSSRWSPSQLADYDGWSLTNVRIFPRGDETTVYNLKVWTGENASTLLIDQPLENLNLNQWNTITIDNPVLVNANEELWVGYTVIDHPAGQYPAGCDDGPAVKGFGDKISLDGTTWGDLKDYGYDFNWNIQGIVEMTDGSTKMIAQPLTQQTPTYNNSSNQISRGFMQAQSPDQTKDFPIIAGYQVFRDGEFQGTVSSITTSYLDPQLPDDIYTYTVSSIFDLGVSLPSSPVQVSIPGGMGPEIIINPMSVDEVHPDPPQVTTMGISVANTGSAMLDFTLEITPPAYDKLTGFQQTKKIKPIQTAIPVEKENQKWNAVKLDPGTVSSLAKDQMVIRYDDGENYGAIGLDGPGSFEAAIYFPSATMISYTGMFLTHVEVYLYQEPYAFKVKIYGPGSSTEPGDPIYIQEVTTPLLGSQWSVIPLGSGIPITGDDLWISYEVVQDGGGQYPAGYDDGPGSIGYGDMNYLDGVWTSMSTYGFDFNWNLAGILSDQAGNISWLSALPIEGSISPDESLGIELTFNSENLPLGIYEALLKFSSNDSVNLVIEVPVSLNVGAVVVNPPSNLEAFVSENDVSLTWDAPENYSGEDLLGYRIFRDGSFIDQTSETFYSDNNLISGTYEYQVTALYDFGESDPSNTVQAVILPSGSDPHILTNPQILYEAHYFPPEITIEELLITNSGEIALEYNIEVIIDSKKMQIMANKTKKQFMDSNPKEPGYGIFVKETSKPGGSSAYATDEVILRYDDGMNYNALGLTGTGTIGAAAYFPEATMAQYAGEYLENIEFYIDDMPIECTVKIYGPGTSTSPGAIIHEQLVTVNSSDWNLVSIWPPLELDGQDIWIGYDVLHNGGQAPAGVDNGPPITGFGDWMTFDGINWYTLTSYGINSNWNIAGYITGEPYIEWMTANPLTGSLGQNESVSIDVTFNSSYLSLGIHEGSVIISSNDPLNPEVIIPVTLDVGGTGLVPPENLEGTVTDNDVHLEWDEPGGGGSLGEWIQWDQGENNGNGIGLTNGGYFYAASHWTPSDLTPYEGQYLSKISFFPNGDPAATFELYVWTGTNAGTQVFSQTVSGYTVSEWNEVELASSVLIDASQELWFGYMITHGAGTFPAGTDDGPAVSGKGDMISLDGTSWDAMGVTFGLDFNWNIAGYVTSSDKDYTDAKPMVKKIPENPSFGPLGSVSVNGLNGDSKNKFNPSGSKAFLQGYNVYRNASNIAYVQASETEYDDIDLDPGIYEYYITADYDEGESVPSNHVYLEIEPPILFPPTNLSGPESVAVGESIDLTWDAPEGGKNSLWAGWNTYLYSGKGFDELLGYNIYRDGVFLNYSTTTSYSDAITVLGQYEYYVTAVYDEGESDPSNLWLVDVLTRIGENNFNEIQVFPNPAKDIVSILSSFDIITFMLFDHSGQVVIKKDNLVQKTVKINLIDLEPGLYFIRINTLQGSYSTQIIIL